MLLVNLQLSQSGLLQVWQVQVWSAQLDWGLNGLMRAYCMSIDMWVKTTYIKEECWVPNRVSGVCPCSAHFLPYGQLQGFNWPTTDLVSILSPSLYASRLSSFSHLSYPCSVIMLDRLARRLSVCHAAGLPDIMFYRKHTKHVVFVASTLNVCWRRCLVMASCLAQPLLCLFVHHHPSIFKSFYCSESRYHFHCLVWLSPQTQYYVGFCCHIPYLFSWCSSRSTHSVFCLVSLIFGFCLCLISLQIDMNAYLQSYPALFWSTLGIISCKNNMAFWQAHCTEWQR